MAQVLAMCGSPITRIIEEVPVRTRVASGFSRFIGFTTTEQWVYDRGWGKFPAVLWFQDGKLSVSSICPTDPEPAEQSGDAPDSHFSHNILMPAFGR